MLQEERGALHGGIAGLQKPALAAVIICAALSVFFINTGILSLLYLAPLGYAVLTSGSVWLPFLATAGANALITAVMRMFMPESSIGLFTEIFYFTALFLCFTWIMSGNKISRMRTVYRFILASAAGTAAFLIFIMGGSRNSAFNEMLIDMAEVFSSLIIISDGSDAVRQSLMRAVFTPENIIQMTRNVLLRGGAIFSVFLLFFVNRHISLLAVRLINKQRNERGLIDFFAPSQAIWALSGAIALILLARFFKIDFLDIIAWNVLVVCAILFFAQGAGIILHFLSRRTNSFRLLCTILIIVAVISPGFNTIALAALLLLGIAEIWVPFRAPKEQAPTPGL